MFKATPSKMAADKIVKKKGHGKKMGMKMKSGKPNFNLFKKMAKPTAEPMDDEEDM